jgi:hypothetical protein
MESRILGDGIGNLLRRSCQFKGFVHCDAGSLWFVIIPKSKDRFVG